MNLKNETIHYKVMVHQINLACGVWPCYAHTTVQRLCTYNKEEVTCGKCKRSRPYKIDNFGLKDI